MKRNLLFNLMQFFAVAAIGGAVTLLVAEKLGYPKSHGTTATSESTASGQTGSASEEKVKVTAAGRIRPKGGVISVSGVPGDRLLMLCDNAKEGTHVNKDDQLAVLESSSLRKAELDLAETQLREAKAREAAEENYAAALLDEADMAEEQVELEKNDLVAQRQKIAALAAHQKSATDDLNRLQQLRDGDDGEIVAQQTLEHQALLAAKAESELAAANAQLKKLNESIELGIKQARAKRATAEASKLRVPSIVQLDSLEQNVKLAQKRVDMTNVYAPSDGTILKVFLSPGETLAQQPILQMANTSQMVVVAEISEEDAQFVEKGDKVRIENKALEVPRLHGTVDHVGTIVARNPVAPSSPTAPADKHVVEAIINLETTDDVMEAARLIELEVTVKILGERETASGANASPSPAAPAGSR